jgi:hypothetical protein
MMFLPKMERLLEQSYVLYVDAIRWQNETYKADIMKTIDAWKGHVANKDASLLIIPVYSF